MMSFDSNSRVLVFAPHPDDETLACGILLQRAVNARASIRVVYVTDGEDNPWPQRALEKKWRLCANDRIRWGKMRRAEALAALRELGVPAERADFLGLPDQKLTLLLTRGCEPLLARFARLIAEFGPTHLFIPSIADRHPDHNALGVMLRLALRKYFAESTQIQTWSYLVHGKNMRVSDGAVVLHKSEIAIARKRLAISCHRSQIKLSRRRFFAYADRAEKFLAMATPLLAALPITASETRDGVLRIELRLSMKFLCAAEPFLLLLGRDADCQLRCAKIDIPARSQMVEVIDLGHGRSIASAKYHGSKFTGELHVPIDSFSPERTLFVKLERRSWFFDEAGWIEMLPIQAQISPDLPQFAGVA